MNYIKHQTTVFALMDANAKVKPLHISLYLALFRIWNRCRFVNPIIITRMEIMKMSKIGSPNTYSKALKALELYGFIRYHPSFDPNQGSKVDMYTFDTGTCTPPVSKVIPFNKHINNTLSIKEEENSFSEEIVSQENTDMKKQQFTPPPIEYIKIYFQQKSQSDSEAERFFNHYESNGWLVGGKSPMKDWKASARNWILNIQKFTTKAKEVSQQRFQNQNKAPNNTQKVKLRPISPPPSSNNYDEPL
ncbi:transcriptional regulator [Saccharicrinis aurantiacus]|uniref:transcriptional regulator n=1 Tax=Saccharicrinis aurantiacus TaxID=1849719 RepID=UPI0011153664|nr:transcriptional regulator [Saccharicrinis aurantiacus]